MANAEFIQHIPCPSCGSSDANSEYSDGHTFCFSCGAYSGGGDETAPVASTGPKSAGFLTGEYQDLHARKLDEATCRKFGYQVGADKRGNAVQIAPYRDASGRLVAQKIRGKDKRFEVIGEGKDMPLFGQHLWPAEGRRVVVTEGEIDALSVAQVCGLRWPVVSLPNGAQGAKKAIQRALEWLCGYESVVLCFDQDEPGRKAAAECAALFPPNKCAIAELPRKDANEMLVAGEVQALSSALWNARPYRPEGIINGADLWAKVQKTVEAGTPYPWPSLTAKTYGQRKRSLVTWTAGSGIGKSTIVSAVAYDLAINHGWKVGIMALEESVERTAQRFMSEHLGKLVHLPNSVTTEEKRAAFDATLGTGRIWLFDHFGSADPESLLSKLRYLIKGCECDAVVLDHLSIAVSGMALDGDERRVIDHTVTALRTVVEDTGALVHLVSHLRRATGGAKEAEEGGRVSLSMLRGSHSIAQLSDYVIGVERDLQGEDGRMLLRVLKNRHSGSTGPAGYLQYDKESGKLTEIEDAAPFEDETGRDF